MVFIKENDIFLNILEYFLFAEKLTTVSELKKRKLESLDIVFYAQHLT